MADSVERLLIRIDASTESLRRQLKEADAAVLSSASIVEKAQARMNASWQGANKYVNQHQTELKLLGAAAVGATALAVKSIITYTDSYQRLQGQLKLVTSSQDELNRVYDATLEVANETGQSLDSTVNLYARLTRATEELGLTETERLRITESINKAMVVSGASTQEAEAAIRQLSQGMASGVLRGEELNSVMENSPRLARALADGLGVGIGQLREMGKEGQLTGERVAGALLKMGSEIDEEFGRMPMTVERAMNRVSNAMADAIGRADMSPMIDAIEAFEAAVSDPSIVNGLTDIASAIVSITVKSAEFVAALGSMSKAVGEWAASQVSGFDPGNLVSYGEELERLRVKLALMEKDGTGKSYLADDLRKQIKEMETVYNLQTKLIDSATAARGKETKATVKQGEAQGKLSAVTVTATARTSKALESHKKTIDAVAKAERARTDKVKDTITALDRQLSAIGMNERAQVIYNATMDAAEYAHGEEIAAIVQKTVALYDQEVAIKATAEETERAAEAAEEAAKASAEAAEKAMQPWNDALQDMAASIDSGFTQAWTDAFSGAEDGFKSFADNMKTAFFNLLGNMAHMAFTRPIVMQISAAMGGLVPGAASAGVPGGGVGSLFSGGLGGMGQGFYEGVGNIASNMGFTGIGDAAYTKGLNTTGWTIGADIAGGFLGGLAGNKVFGQTSGIGAGLGGIAGSIAIPIPGVGSAIGSFVGAGVEKALDKVFGGDNDGNNAGAADFNLADRTNVGRTWGKTPGPENADAAVQLAAGLQSFADAIGGSSLAANITVGRKGIEYGGQNYGQDAEAFYEDAIRDVIENATGLNQAMKDLALAFEGTAEETAAYIMAMANMAEAIQTNPVEQAMADTVASMDNASGGIMSAYNRQIDALRVLISEYDGSASATVELNDALVVSRNNAYQLAVAIIGMSKAISDMLGDQAQYFAEAVMTEEQLRAARAAQRDDLINQLRTATDPEQVQELVNQFATVNKQLFDSLSKEQQLAQVTTFTNMANEVDTIAQSILGTALTDLKVSQDDINRQMMAAVTGAAGALQSAANDMGGHVTTFGEYVAQLVSRGITINVNSLGAEVAA